MKPFRVIVHNLVSFVGEGFLFCTENIPLEHAMKIPIFLLVFHQKFFFYRFAKLPQSYAKSYCPQYCSPIDKKKYCYK